MAFRGLWEFSEICEDICPGVNFQFHLPETPTFFVWFQPICLKQYARARFSVVISGTLSVEVKGKQVELSLEHDPPAYSRAANLLEEIFREDEWKTVCTQEKLAVGSAVGRAL